MGGSFRCDNKDPVTQILSVICPQFVVQASDRRVTSLLTGAVLEDQQKKTVFSCGHMAWAFTGPARMGTTRTADWISDKLASVTSLQQGVEEMRSRATTRLRNADPANRRLAI